MTIFLGNSGSHFESKKSLSFSKIVVEILSSRHSMQGHRRHLKLGGGDDTSRALFSLRKRGHFPEIKKALLFFEKSWGSPVPMSMISCWKETKLDCKKQPNRYAKIASYD